LGLSLVRLWIGAVVVVLSGCLGALAVLPDKIFDPDIIAELGSGYLGQQRLSGFAPVCLGFIVWAIVAGVRWQPGTFTGWRDSVSVSYRTPPARRH
jgi:hypothetical protein